MRRNKNKLIKNILTYSVVSTTLLGNTIPTFAYSNSVDSVKETQTINSDEASSCDVYAQLAATFTVTIPKKITLSGTDKTGSYSVDVEGDIGGTDIINVVPDASVALKSTNLANVTASIIQDKTKWSYSEILPSSKTTGSGSIYADGTNNSGEISAGVWNGTFNFNISLKENSSLITVEAKNESGENLNASASEITGTQKDTLLDKLVDSGLVKSVDEIDALIEVESDEFGGIAETTFNVSSIANEGDKVAILHFNEKTNEWEYVSTETVNNDGTITADFSSYSPVAFVTSNIYIWNVYNTTSKWDLEIISCSDRYGYAFDTINYDRNINTDVKFYLFNYKTGNFDYYKTENPDSSWDGNYFFYYSRYCTMYCNSELRKDDRYKTSTSTGLVPVYFKNPNGDYVQTKFDLNVNNVCNVLYGPIAKPITIYNKSEYIEIVTSTKIDAYPQNGELNELWYELQGQ